MSHIDLAQAREKLYSAVVADACDACGLKTQSPAVALPAVTVSGVLVGRCRTSLWEEIDFEDPAPYELELQLVDSCRPDDVLICAADGSMSSGIWGELLTTAASNRGCVGVVVDGAVRDVRQMTAMGFPAYARGRCVYDSLNRQRVIEIDGKVEIGGVEIRAGDFVIADADGVVVVPQAREQEVLRLAWEKVHAENVTRDAIRGGMGAVEAYEKFGVL